MQRGTWIEATFTNNPVIDGEEQYNAVLDYSSNKSSAPRSPTAPPVNIHGNKMFMVKVLRPYATIGFSDPNDIREISLMVYDRGRTFKGHISMQDNPEFCTEALHQMPELKIYRYAKRLGNWTLSVCMDREPSDTPEW